MHKDHPDYQAGLNTWGCIISNQRVEGLEGAKVHQHRWPLWLYGPDPEKLSQTPWLLWTRYGISISRSSLIEYWRNTRDLNQGLSGQQSGWTRYGISISRSSLIEYWRNTRDLNQGLPGQQSRVVTTILLPLHICNVCISGCKKNFDFVESRAKYHTNCVWRYLHIQGHGIVHASVFELVYPK